MGIGEPETDAGRRTVALPAAIATALEQHVADAPDALLFSTSTGSYLARSNWKQTFRRAGNAIGLPAVRPHDPRHTGATHAAATGATTRTDAPRGHSSPAAALLYQHAADDREAEIARSLDAMLSAVHNPSDDDPESDD